ncbi:MerR family transcriptional regulator [Paenibacillus psychroresistens]|nr:MerR family transcriptional regulator [Paenibacillus psychroresistens]
MMTISVFSEQTGLRPKTLRYYEEIGLLVPNVRAANGYRQYEDNQIESALLIHSLRQADVGIADIRRFMAGDWSEQDQLLQRWREEAEARMLSLQIARQFLQGFHPRTRHLRLVRWEKPKKIAWFPLPKEMGTSIARMFDPNNGLIDRLALSGGATIRTCYVHYEETQGRFDGKIGYEMLGDKEPLLGRTTVTKHPQTLFVAIECNPDRSAPCQPVFASIRECGFEPVGTLLRQYSAERKDRYTLLIPVMLQTPS